MNAKHEKSETAWIDPDDAPEWTDTMFAEADLHENGKLIRRGRPRAEVPKDSITIRLDHDLAVALRASGRGWQTRVNDALREWLNRPAE